MGHALWFAGRATGLVALLLLTATVVLGASHSGRVSTGGWPRFTLHAIHRNLSLIALVFISVHISCATVDPYAEIRWVDAVLPFGSAYRPFWLGLGAVALDLMLAVQVTSMLRSRIGLRTWRAVHLSAYAMWPVAVAHGLGTGGADSRLGWVLGLNIACGAAAATAVARRLLARHPDAEARRAAEPSVR